MILNTSKEPWISDSGATHHIICSPRYYTHDVKKVKSFVQLPNELTIPISHIGTIRVNTYLILRNILCIPTFRINLVSIHKIVKDNDLSAIISKDGCLITHEPIPWSKSLSRIGKIENQRGLYQLKFQDVCDSKKACAINKSSRLVEVSSHMWHFRLGLN